MNKKGSPEKKKVYSRDQKKKKLEQIIEKYKGEMTENQSKKYEEDG